MRKIKDVCRQNDEENIWIREKGSNWRLGNLHSQVIHDLHGADEKGNTFLVKPKKQTEKH
jgi:hypothetical protein